MKKVNAKLNGLKIDLADNQEAVNVSEEQVELLFFEEFNQELDAKFLNGTLIPYFQQVFSDLALRSFPSQSESQNENQDSIDKVTFFEYINLPGILSDRFYSLLTIGSTRTRIIQRAFVHLMSQVYRSSLNKKMELAFTMFDFDNDGRITSVDVHLLLSYIPFRYSYKNDKKTHLFANVNEIKVEQPHQRQEQEGMVSQSECFDMTTEQRSVEQDQIRNFVQFVFKEKQSFGLKDFIEFNTTVSSEMFISVMTILHERLPCTQYYHRQRQIFKDKEIKMEYQKMEENKNSTHNQQSVLVKAEAVVMSPFKAIASPQILTGWSPSKRINVFAFKGLAAEPQHSPLKQSIFRGSARIESQLLIETKDRKDSDVSLSQFLESSKSMKEDNFVPIQFMESSKMRKMQDARRNWRKDHSDNSPFPAHKQQLTQIQNESPFLKNSIHAVKDQIQKQFSWKNAVVQQEEEERNTFSFNDFDLGQGSPKKQLFESKGRDYQNPEMILQGFGNYKKEEAEIFQDYCYLKTRSDQFKRHWAVIDCKEIFIYRRQGDKEHRVMHCLAGTFVKEIPIETDLTQGKIYYPIKIMLPPNKSRIIYLENQETFQLWNERLKQAMGYNNIFDYYEIGTTLGKGQFGLVKLALHKRTGQSVAIKVVKKINMKPIEMIQQRREIEVLKMCQHPNIIKLLDIFENSDNYFIVIEYMEGKDLFDYIQKRNFLLPETRVKHLVCQLITATRYIHDFGIVHRDLKLENIMMSDVTNNAKPKLVDFGLARIISPNETANEPFGTLGYVAPEVLKKKPYSFSCDVWSIGCIMHALLTGSLPFDHESQRETIRMTLEDVLKLDDPCWVTISSVCKDLVLKMLTKDPDQRITLIQAYNHEFFASVREKYQSSLNVSPLNK